MPQREPYDLTVRYQAEDLFVEEGLTFDEVAERTGVSVTTLKRWSADGEQSWTELRRQRLETRKSIRANLVRIRKKLAERAVNNPNPKDIYALKALEELAMASQKKESEFSADVFGQFFRDLIEFLRENDPEAVTVLVRNFEEFSAFIRRKYVG